MTIAVMRMRTHADRAIVIARVTDRRMRAIIGVQVIANMPRIIVRIPRTVVRVVVVCPDARIVIISRCRPVMAVRPLNVTPSVAHIQRMLTHVVIRIEIDIRHVIARITDEHIAAVADDIEVFRIRCITVRMRTCDRTPVRIAIDIINRMRPEICHGCNRCGTARVVNV